MDEQYQVYLNRVLGMTRSDHYQNQWSLIQSSPKFSPNAAGAWEPKPFPGYTVVTPPGSEDSANPRFYGALTELQHRLAELLPAPFGLLLPPASFHFTLADLIWDGAYAQAAERDPDYETKLQASIRETFDQQAPKVSQDDPILLQGLGLMVMTRAIGICLAPHTEADYDRLLDVRRAVYQNPNLLGLGIEQQYHFTGHITLGYFGQLPNQVDTMALSQALTELNKQFLEDSPEFTLDRVELRKFDNMHTYSRETDWPTLRF
ncbi:MAG: DUF1868 domain-containing protein [Prochlorothrix sp.]|nr:DUF1868 domain-containing protein [Prochlorothrix sp.]